MSPRALILILAAIVAVAGTVYFANSWLNQERAQLEAMREKPKEEPEQAKVLVTDKALGAGMFVRKEDVRWAAWPDDGPLETYMVQGTDDPADIVGGVVRHRIEAGEPIAKGQIVTPGDRGFMAAVLNPGMRAVSVPVKAATSVSGFIFPGDTVDLILTMGFTRIEEGEGEGKSREQRYGSETFLTGVRVLAVDQQAEDRENQPSVGETVTVEVTPKQVEMLTVAMQLGRMSMALHSLARPDQPAPEALAEGEEIQLAAANDSAADGTATDANGAAAEAGSDGAAAEAGSDGAAANGAERSKPRLAGEIFEVPAPGRTFTVDSQASRLRGATLVVKDGDKVTQLRGGSK